MQEDRFQLLRSVAEQLKLPLTTIARQAELAQLTQTASLNDMAAMQTHAEAALMLVDSYLLGLQLLGGQVTLELEPVSVSSLLVEVAHVLAKPAKQYGVRLELEIGGKYGPVMAHRRGLKAALFSLGYGLLETATDAKRELTLAVHRTPRGIVTGLYGNYDKLGMQEWRTALAAQGAAQQPFTALCASNGAGLLVADAILRAMETQLRVGKYSRRYGMATTLQTSQQLAFV